MLRKLHLLFLLLALPLLGYAQATQPVISEGDNVKWYFIQFLSRDFVLEAQANGMEVKTGSISLNDNQLWKVEGDEAAGYTLTSRSGMHLYTTSTAVNGMFRSSTNATSNTRFVWSASTNTAYANSGFVLSPKANTEVFMNQWGGAGLGKSLGLYNKKDDENQPFRFLAEEEALRTDQKLALIPYPEELTQGEGTLSLKSLTTINYIDETTHRYAEDFANIISLTSGHKLLVNDAAVEKGITMTLDATLPHEAYRLNVTTEGVSIAAADSTGFFYALQTIKQLLPNAVFGNELDSETEWTMPVVSIADRPAFSHRGFMLDIARHYFSPAAVKRVLDIMSAYKLNRLHWHLTDDQGWRIEIPEYPRLTEVGSIRSGSFTNEGGSEKFFDDTEYGRGMWYSLDDLREIVRYAKARNIEILPEIDLPGHMVAAVTAYPEFSCDPTKKYEVRVLGGISEDVLNIGKDEVIDFLKCVLGHVADVFPYPYIHLGGDECPTTQWKTNADCLRRVQEEKLGSVDNLQSWLVNLLGRYLRDEKGKGIVVWDEVLKHWDNTNEIRPVVMAWNKGDWSKKAAEFGLKSIRSPHTALYLDFMQMPPELCDINEGYQGGWGVNTLDEVYNLNPLGEVLGTPYENKDFILGVQGNMWTETCSDTLQLEYQMFPRLLALSETAWLPEEQKNWLGFYSRLQSHDEILDRAGYNYARHHFINNDTPAEAAIKEARAILDASFPDAPGYPAKSEYDNLLNALNSHLNAPDNAEILGALTDAITSYKAAPVCKPKEGKYYQLVSAATYYKARYDGSTAYVKDDKIRFHYTPQTEPEELWSFTTSGTGFKMANVLTSKLVNIPANGQDVTLADNGTTILVEKATTPSAQYDYVPGALTFTALGSTGTGARRLFGHASGYIKADNDGSLCKAGTWRLKEVTDYSCFLKGLVDKCNHLLLITEIGEEDEAGREAITFLTDELITPATAILTQGDEVSRETYMNFVTLYTRYLNYAKTAAVSKLSEDYYYRIRNAYPEFADYYAKSGANSTVERATLAQNDDAFLWNIKKNNDGSILLYNKQSKTAAFPENGTEGAKIKLGRDYNWTLEEVVTDQGNKGIAIIASGDTFGWYINPGVWSYVLLKPKKWGGSIWSFEQTNEQTAVNDLFIKPETTPVYYDLQGRRVERPERGAYITDGGEKVIK